MILTTKTTSRAPSLTHDRCSPVLTGVVVAPKPEVVAAHDEEGYTEIVEDKVVAGVRSILGASGNDPRPGKHAALLKLPEFVAGVSSGRYGREGRKAGWRTDTGEPGSHIRLHSGNEFGVHPVTLSLRSIPGHARPLPGPIGSRANQSPHNPRSADDPERRLRPLPDRPFRPRC